MSTNKSAGFCAAAAALASLGAAMLPRIGAIDERFLSYNVEMAEVIGGKFWKPYDAPGSPAAPQAAPAAATPGGGGVLQ